MKVMLIDDHPLVLTALQSLIHTLDPGTVVVTAVGPDDAFDRLAAEPDVDLVLLDLLLGQAVDGYALLADLRLMHPGLPVVVVSAIDRLADMVKVIDMGAMGFVPKCASPPELFEALSLVLSGGVFIPPALLQLAHGPGKNLAEAAAAADLAAMAAAEVARERQRAGHLARAAAAASGRAEPASAALQRPMAPAAPAGADGPAETAAPEAPEAPEAPDAATAATAATAASVPVVPVVPAPPAAPTAPPVALLPGQASVLERAWLAAMGMTPRQCDVLALLLKGLPNKLIARELSLSVDTVKDHVAAVLRALQVSSRTQAVVAVGRQMQASGLAIPPRPH